MWRWVGALLLLGGGLYLGMSLAGETGKRIRALEAWQGVLTLLTGELSFRLPTMAQLLETLSHRASPPAKEALVQARAGLEELGERSFPDIWAAAVVRCSGALTREDVEDLQGLGTFLGRCGWEEQKLAAQALSRTLGDRADRLRQEAGREGKVYCTLGLSLAAFLTILLL